MYEVYRVRKRFQWRGWEYAPKGACSCGCEGCTGQVGSGCMACPSDACRCDCNIPPERYGGDIWIIEAGHPRKDIMLRHRFGIGDGSLNAEELLKQDEYKRLLSPPGAELKAQLERREAEPVARGPGRPRK